MMIVSKLGTGLVGIAVLGATFVTPLVASAGVDPASDGNQTVLPNNWSAVPA